MLLQDHDREWGCPVHNDRKHSEVLVLSGAQAGLSWSLVLKKREGYRRAFDKFDPDKVAHYSERQIQKLTSNPEIIRNRMKIEAAVRHSSKFRESSGTLTLTAGVSDLLVIRYQSRTSKRGRSFEFRQADIALCVGREPSVLCSAVTSRVASDSVRKEILMSTSTVTTSSTSVYTTPAFWERLWRTAGILGERRILGTGRRLFALHLARHRPAVGHGREWGALDPESCYTYWMVSPTLDPNQAKGPETWAGDMPGVQNWATRSPGGRSAFSGGVTRG